MAMIDKTDFQRRVEEFKQVRGESVRIDEVASIVESLLDTLDGDVSSLDLRLYKELESLAQYIQRAKTEIAQLRPDEIREDFISPATDELDAIVSSTEEATGSILDAAEALENVASSLDDERGQKITDAVTQIYEACNFQDVTGQRITKVVRSFQHIEAEIEKLVGAFGDEIKKGDREPREKPKKAETSDADLLHGPQLPDSAQNQAEIDALLESFD